VRHGHQAGQSILAVIERLTDMPPGTFDLGVRHHEAWIGSAIVTDIAWMARATKLFAWMIPGEARVPA
jgi:aminopeptidase-like protein